MTATIEHARLVLNDAKHLYDTQFIEGVRDADWRILYYSIVSLLRSVGYVLDKVEAAKSQRHRQIISAEYEQLKKSKPEPEIFWKFIETERNQLLKEYTSSSRWRYRLDNPVQRDKEGNIVGSGPRTEEWRYEIVRGHYAGREQGEVIQEALRWWDSYLSEIERQLTNQ